MVSAIGCESIIPSLEPLLGPALALNLAYLNLPALAYITIVSQSISSALHRLDPTTTDSVQNTEWYKQLKAISEVKRIDYPPTNEARQWWISTPVTFWGFLFNILFYWRIGKLAAILFTVYSSYYLVLGVLIGSDLLPSAACYAPFSSDGWSLIITLLALFWPMAMAACGAWVKVGANHFLVYQMKALGNQTFAAGKEEVVNAVTAVAKRGRPKKILPPDRSASDGSPT